MPPTLDTRMPNCNGIDIEEATITKLQNRMQDGIFTSEDLTKCYLERTARLNGALKAIIETNPDALAIARRRDTERKRSHVRGPLHGIPFYVKDFVLIGAKVPDDANVVKLLRNEGAVLLGHANMSEWASMRASYYAEAYSSRGGQMRNPYNFAENPGGSSSGPAAAVATNMCAFSIGTETDSTDRMGVVGLKPTVGRTSCEGVIPESHTYDTVGVIARTVMDAAMVLDVISQSPSALSNDIAAREILRGARFGIPWKQIWEHAARNESTKGQYQYFLKVVKKIQRRGVKVFRVEIPSASELYPVNGGWDWDYPSKIGHPEHSAYTVVKTDFYNDLKKYLAGLVTNPNNIRSLEDVVEYNIKHTEKEGGVPGTHPAWPTGQDGFDKCLALKGIEGDTYKTARLYVRGKTRDEGIDEALVPVYRGKPLDGLLVPVQADGGVATEIAAQAGYPMITIPVNTSAVGVPYGLAIIQAASKEDQLVKYAAAIEAIVGHRPRPLFRHQHVDKWIYVGIPPEEKESDTASPRFKGKNKVW
ncbi:amidase [Astrocystis sublimbata]|nr:amidase [Astrocystis sublimbata]